MLLRMRRTGRIAVSGGAIKCAEVDSYGTVSPPPRYESAAVAVPGEVFEEVRTFAGLA
jgi:hypothetical protein